MRNTFLISICALFFAACNTPVKKELPDPKGKWESMTPWDNNTITLTVRPDSTILFKAKKLFCPGTKYFISVGKWSIENDSFLVMKKFTDGRKYELKDIFPELTHIGSDSVNIVGLELEAKFILTKDSLYDIETSGKRSKEKIYVRKNN
ncbi:hypothetical protein BH09BAC5_BH09BAC5_21360 [soil metagenome]